MASHPSKWQVSKSESPVIDWPLDSEPSIRWQVLRDLTGAPAEGANVMPDDRMAEAIVLVESKRDVAGGCPLEVPYPGRMPFELDVGEGEPSRWITLRALRVLDWYST